MRGGTSVMYGYIKLCAAIVNSGIEQNDCQFLYSDWCRMLIDAVVEWNNRNTDKDTYTYLGT